MAGAIGMVRGDATPVRSVTLPCDYAFRGTPSRSRYRFARVASASTDAARAPAPDDEKEPGGSAEPLPLCATTSTVGPRCCTRFKAKPSRTGFGARPGSGGTREESHRTTRCYYLLCTEGSGSDGYRPESEGRDRRSLNDRRRRRTIAAAAIAMTATTAISQPLSESFASVPTELPCRLTRNGFLEGTLLIRLPHPRGWRKGT
jgi:hypothetical protein